MREPLSDELFEVVLKQAVYDADKADLEELPSEKEMNQAYPLPEKAHKEFDRLQKAQTRGISVRTMLARRVAIIAITALAVVFGGLMLHPDIRAGVSHIVVQQFEKFNLFRHDENGKAKQFISLDDVSIDYLPEGYELEWDLVDETRRSYYYINENHDLLISVLYSELSDISLDNEHEYEIKYINQREMHVSYDPATQSGAIIIPGEVVTVSIAGNLPKEELLAVAQNIK